MTAAEIKELRARLGLSQTEFAALIGVHPITLCRWETDRCQPTTFQLVMLQTFCDAAGKQTVRKQLRATLGLHGLTAALKLIFKQSH